MSFPLVIVFIGYYIIGTFSFFLLSHEPIETTEALSLILLFFNSVITAINWGISFGYQILGSKAYALKDYQQMRVYYQEILFILVAEGLVMMIFSHSILSLLLTILKPNEDSKEKALGLIVYFIPGIFFLSLQTSYIRTLNILQKTEILTYTSGIVIIVFMIFSYFLFSILNLGVLSIGVSYSLFFFIFQFTLGYYFKYYDEHNLISFTFSNISFKNIVNQIKFGFFPLLNIILFQISLDTTSFFGFLIDDLSFTVITVYMNILCVLITIAEAISCSMSSIIAFYLGKGKGEMSYKIFYTTIVVSGVIQLLFIIILLVYSETILSVFSTDSSFLKLGKEGLPLLSVAILISSYHFILSEFIIIYGNHTLPFYSVLVGKFIGQGLLSYILVSYMNLKIYGIVLSIIIGQLGINISYIWFIYTHVKFEEGRIYECDDFDSEICAEDLKEKDDFTEELKK